MVKKKSLKKTSQGTPDWARQPFNAFLDYVENLEVTLRLSIRGISMIRAIPKAVEALAKIDTALEETNKKKSYAKKLKQAKADGELAQKEVDNGFPILHAQAVIALWGILESQTRSFLAAWLANEPKALFVSQVQKLRIQLGDYESLSQDERPYYILDLLERDVQAPLKQGINRFESLLAIFGLGGEVNETIGKDLFEMHQIRNVLVHRQGIADKRLVLACPWLKISIGDIIVVSHKDYERYSHAALCYVVELIIRIGAHFGTPRNYYRELEKIVSEESFQTD